MRTTFTIFILATSLLAAKAQNSNGVPFGPSRVLDLLKVQMTSTNEIICFGTGVDDDYIPKLPYTDRNAYQLFLAKSDTLGNLKWYKNYGSKNEIDEGIDVIEAIDGGFLILGNVGEYVPTRSHYPNNIHLIKTDTSGNVEWEKYFEGYPSSIFQLKNGNIYLLGAIENGLLRQDKFQDYDLQVRILSENGDLVGSNNFPNTHGVYASAVGLMSSFRLYQTADSSLSFLTRIYTESKSGTYSIDGTSEYFNVWLIKTDMQLNEISRLKIDSLKFIHNYWIADNRIYIKTDKEVLKFIDLSDINTSTTFFTKMEGNNTFQVQDIAQIENGVFYYNNNDFDLHIRTFDQHGNRKINTIFRRDNWKVGLSYVVEDRNNYYFVCSTTRKPEDITPKNWGNQLFFCKQYK